MEYHVTDSETFFNSTARLNIPASSANNARYVFRHTDEQSPPVDVDNLGWHFHTCYELLYFLRGDADYQIEQRWYTLRPHSLLIIKPGEYHNMRVKSQRRLDRIVVHFTDNDLTPESRTMLHKMSNVYCIPGTRLSEEILRVDTYVQDLEHGIPKSILTNHLQIILAFLLNIEDMRQTADQTHDGAERIISFIHSDLTSIHSLDDICQNVHMSRSTVQNLISEYLQTPVMSYVRTQKCIMAQSLLQNGCSATEAALRCGFSDYSTFYRAYRKVFGTAPTNVGAEIRTIPV